MEKHIEGRLRIKVQRKGGMCLKWTSPGMRGVPDRIVFMPDGKSYLVETKVRNGELSIHQVRMHKLLRSLGFEVYVLLSNEDVDKFVNGI